MDASCARLQARARKGGSKPARRSSGMALVAAAGGHEAIILLERTGFSSLAYSGTGPSTALCTRTAFGTDAVGVTVTQTLSYTSMSEHGRLEAHFRLYCALQGGYECREASSLNVVPPRSVKQALMPRARISGSGVICALTRFERNASLLMCSFRPVP